MQKKLKAKLSSIYTYECCDKNAFSSMTYNIHVTSWCIMNSAGRIIFVITGDI